jgi:hypothetical protein
MDIVRNGELEATNYFFSLGDHENVLEVSSTTTGAGTSWVTRTDTSPSPWTISTTRNLKEQGIEPEREPYQVREGRSWLTFVRDPDSCFATSS